MATPQPGVWGIDLGQCALKAIRLQEIDGQIKATAFDYIEHPKILSQPDADPDQLTREALEQFLSRNKLKGDTVVVSVPGQTGLARFVKLPPVEEKKIADIVKFEAKQQIPFPLEEVVWDFQKLGSGEVTDGFALETEIGLFAMKRDMVNRAIQQFREVAVEVHVVQMAPLALSNFVAYEFLDKAPAEGEETSSDKACVVALEIGTDNSNLIITDGGKIIWQRPIPLGGNHFTRALTKDLKLTFAKAEHLKRNAIKSPDLKKILASLKTVLNDFVGEVQRSLGYFTNTHRDARIEYMLGLGNAFRLPGLQKYLQEKLQLEVRKPQKLGQVGGEEVLKAPQFSENLLTFGVAIGLALQGIDKARIRTNLLPQEIRFERLVRAKKPWAAAAVAALLLAIAGIAFASSLELKAVQNKELDDKMAAAEKELKAAGDLESQFNQAKGEVDASEAAIKRIKAGEDERFNWRYALQYVNLSLPKPDGSNLVDRGKSGRFVKRDYGTDAARKALEILDERRFAGEGEAKGKGGRKKTLADVRKEDEHIKKFLIQINIEGVNALYTEDVPAFFKAIPKENTFRGMDDLKEKPVAQDLRDAKELAEESKALVPAKAWIVEIRGYTYHTKKADFVEDTILQNLFPPDFKDPDKLPPEQKKLYDIVLKRVRFLFIYDIKTELNPQQGVYTMIGQSSLRTLLGGGIGGAGDPRAGGPVVPPPMGPGDPMGMEPAVPEGPPKIDRSAWTAMGQVAGTALGGGGGGPMIPGGGVIMPPIKVPVPMPIPGDKGVPGDKVLDKKDKEVIVPRTEFIIFFVWDEPILAEATAADATKEP